MDLNLFRCIITDVDRYLGEFRFVNASNQDQAIADGFLGFEWWVQSRLTGSPKEYHLDTAITWCRDHNIEPNYCPYCPAVASVFYLNDIGGPTGMGLI